MLAGMDRWPCERQICGAAQHRMAAQPGCDAAAFAAGGCGGSGIAASQLLGLVEHATSQAMGGAQQSAHGGGLALTSIVRCAVLLVAPTESVTWKETVRAAGLAEGSLVENSTERSAAW